jgi:hypothetical protein
MHTRRKRPGAGGSTGGTATAAVMRQ